MTSPEPTPNFAIEMQFEFASNNQILQPVLIDFVREKLTKDGRRPPTPTIVFETYWRFAQKRQDLFFAKLNCPSKLSWTDDPILSKHRFTNAYRAADRVSQYLIKNVLYDKDHRFEDVIFRCLLFKTFNKIETWREIDRNINNLVWRPGVLDEVDRVLAKHESKGNSLYSGAYIMPSVKSAFGHAKKFRNHLSLLENIMSVTNDLRGCNSLEQLYRWLLRRPGLGPFLSFQYAIDLNYSDKFSFNENDYIVAGPGAKHGISKCFSDLGDYSFEEIISFMTEVQEEAFRLLSLNFQTLWGRRLHLIDCQNLFCEVDKYSRLYHPDIKVHNGRTRIKQSYRPRPNDIQYFFPPKWNLRTPNVETPDT